MTDRVSEPKKQTQVDPRADLFSILQMLSGLVEARVRRGGSNTAILDEEIVLYQKQNEIV